MSTSAVIDRDFDRANDTRGADGEGQQLRPKFTVEELRALKECNRESFYYRCLPIGTVLGSMTFFAVKAGYLTGSVRFGATPKVLIASTIGYFIGKFSYQQKCIDKLIALPNSPLGEQLRRQRGLAGVGGGGGGDAHQDNAYNALPIFNPPPFAATGPATESDDTSQVFTDVGDTRPLDSFDTELSKPESDAENKNSKVNTFEEEIRPPAQTTYEELRKYNREDFARGGQVKGRTFTNTKGEQKATTEVRNAYGDVWEKTE